MRKKESLNLNLTNFFKPQNLPWSSWSVERRAGGSSILEGAERPLWQNWYEEALKIGRRSIRLAKCRTHENEHRCQAQSQQFLPSQTLELYRYRCTPTKLRNNRSDASKASIIFVRITTMLLRFSFFENASGTSRRFLVMPVLASLNWKQSDEENKLWCTNWPPSIDG